MTTLYFAQCDEDTLVACATANEGKALAKGGYESLKKPRNVYKVELNKDMGTRELMCKLFNYDGSDESFMGSKEVIYTAGPRTRKGKVAEEEEVPPEFAGVEEPPEFDINDI